MHGITLLLLVAAVIVVTPTHVCRACSSWFFSNWTRIVYSNNVNVKLFLYVADIATRNPNMGVCNHFTDNSGCFHLIARGGVVPEGETAQIYAPLHSLINSSSEWNDYFPHENTTYQNYTATDNTLWILHHCYADICFPQENGAVPVANFATNEPGSSILTRILGIGLVVLLCAVIIGTVVFYQIKRKREMGKIPEYVPDANVTVVIEDSSCGSSVAATVDSPLVCHYSAANETVTITDEH